MLRLYLPRMYLLLWDELLNITEGRRRSKLVILFVLLDAFMSALRLLLEKTLKIIDPALPARRYFFLNLDVLLNLSLLISLAIGIGSLSIHSMVNILVLISLRLVLLDLILIVVSWMIPELVVLMQWILSAGISKLILIKWLLWVLLIRYILP